MGLTTGRRRIVTVVSVAVMVAVTAITAYRVLAPAEVSTTARGEYPAAADREAGVVGRLPVAPLIVDGRLRVYAAQRQVYADGPVDARHRGTPYWSYRRWPAEVSGVVADGTTVVSHWSDGKLVALDARTGRVAWQVDGPVPAEGWTARRTGAGAVWSPAGLFHTGAGGASTLVVSGPERLAAFALDDGRLLWSTEVDDDCRSDVGTTTNGRFAVVDRCGGPAVVEFLDVRTGTPVDRWEPPGAAAEWSVTPVGCVTEGVRCGGLRVTGPGDDGGRGWLLAADGPVAAPALDPTDAELHGEWVVRAADGVVTGRSARDGDEVWRRADLGAVRIVAVQPDRVHLLTETNDLITVDPATGVERSRFVLNVGADGVGWAPGAAYASGGYLALERLRQPPVPEADDQRYFLTSEPLVLAAT
ncbi:pyrrolo-quinoline quinone [Verrucosispora sp. SN26_14.1]|uniref:outer membrane protein assembly factor BamB family protein n=1 Tax=Verrucosispora sp. SN26_14.1 TaxID=2527879 RepID=UPI001033CA2F|nr:PQQ-binding-like beta-propeller repeat protein [Verrucosispora sp. SN26_14.1]TBL31644.1 pyrrolo-quinoline quinone [Verrucosispora sp. SN26_14.1]